jgi:nicotinamidase-related amidase
MNIARQTALNSTLLVVDVQDKLLVKMPNPSALVRDVAFLIDVAKAVQVPILATEQYPKGLGPTTGELRKRLAPILPAKMTFSCCGAPGLLAALRVSGRPHVVLAGMETHVCVMQTALDLLGEGLNVFLPSDALQARFLSDHNIALHRMERAGAIVTSVEATAFEWLGSAEHPQFKVISKLIQERMAALQAAG